MNVNTITLDVSKQPRIGQVLYLGQSDTDGATLAVNVMDHGAPLTLTGYSVSLMMRFPDGETYEFQGTVSGSTATFTVDASDMEPGKTNIAYVLIEGSGFAVSTERFHVRVLDNAEA